MMKKIVILISGRGSNMRAIISACARQKWPAQVSAVIADRTDAEGLKWAIEQGIATETLVFKEYATRAAFDRELMARIDRYQPDFVLLAGFMRRLSNAFVAHYSQRLLNIHPSLLPSFRGLNTHQQALDAGVKVHGATVHLVDEELDAGPIIAQSVVPVLPDDTAHTLAARVLEIEHILYPQVIRWLIEGKLIFIANGTVVKPLHLHGEPMCLWWGDLRK